MERRAARVAKHVSIISQKNWETVCICEGTPRCMNEGIGQIPSSKSHPYTDKYESLEAIKVV